MPVKDIHLPVAGIPIDSPVCVPIILIRAATLSPSAIRSSMSGFCAFQALWDSWHDIRSTQVFCKDFHQTIQVIAVVEFLITTNDMLILFDGHDALLFYQCMSLRTR